MARVRERFTAEERLSALQTADRDMWMEGVDFCADIVNDNSSFAVKEKSQIYYRSFAEVFGLKQSNLDRCRDLVTSYPNTTLSPHSTYSVQQSDFEAVCSSHPDLMTIHFKESEGEQQLFDNQGALAEWYRAVGFECDFLDYRSPAERIVRTIPACQSVMFVHNCHLTQADIDTIMGHFTAPVYWALCPRSNSYISGAKTAVHKLLMANNLNILIGTDSLASNSSLSIIEELKCFADVPLQTLLGWATTNGYKALNCSPRGWVNIDGVNLQTMTITEQATAKRVL